MAIQNLFTKLLDMSLTASVVIVIVLAARMLLLRMPKIFSYALWFVVLFRLLCPLTISSSISLFQFISPSLVSNHYENAAPVKGNDLNFTEGLEVHKKTGFAESSNELRDQSVNESADQLVYSEAGQNKTENKRNMSAWNIGAAVWLIGVILILGYSVSSLFRLKGSLIGATPLQKNIYLSDYVPSPFVFGIFKPRVFLPSALSEPEREYILLHEQAHIKRGDHIFKMLFFFAVMIHWFNPLSWLSFLLFEKDMEMSCDETVMRHMQRDIRADYCASLLSLSSGKRHMIGALLAFGENNTKSRIKNIMRYKKPILIVSVAAVALVTVLAAALCSDPHKKSADSESNKQNNLTASESTKQPESTESPTVQTRELEEIKQHLAGFSSNYEELLESQAFIQTYNGDYNKQYLDEFLKKVENKSPATLDLIAFTIEGDAVIQYIDYNGQDFFVVHDSSRDAFGAPGEEYLVSTWPYLKQFEGVLGNGDQYSYILLTKDDTITQEQIDKLLQGASFPESFYQSIQEIAYVVTGNVNAQLTGNEAWHDLASSFDERTILRSQDEIYKIEIIKNATGETFVCSSLDHSDSFSELLKFYENLDISPDEELEFRRGASYTMRLYGGSEENLLQIIQTVVPYKDAIKINGTMYDGSINGTTTQLLMKLEQMFEKSDQ